MQHRTLTWPRPHLRDLLTDIHTLTLTNQKRAVMAISTQVIVIVFNDKKRPVPRESATRVNNLTRRSGANRLTLASRNLHT